MSKEKILAVLGFLLLTGCNEKLHTYSKNRNTIENYSQVNDSTLRASGISRDPKYGFTEENPIMLGLVDVHKAADNIEKYLNALLGPNGEEMLFKRLKPCCPFKTKNFRYKHLFLDFEFDHKYGMLEKYEVSFREMNQIKSFILFFNLYDETQNVLAPNGFTYKTGQ